MTISGPGVNEHGGDGAYEMTGAFMGKEVYLGEVRTDDAGRMLFLGGRGVSASADGSPLVTFANNPMWHDDVSDGPVDAIVEYQGRPYEATGAWVLVGPPDYAPGVQGIVTGYDLLFEVATQLDASLLPRRPTFSQNIYPLLRRFSQHQWGNAGFARDFGFGTPADFGDPAFVARLNPARRLGRARGGRAARRLGAGRRDALDGGALAVRHLVLPLGLHPVRRRLLADVLARARAQRRPEQRAVRAPHEPEAPLGERERVLGFHRRVKWLRGIRYPMKPEVPPRIFPSKPAINKFLRDWWKVGIIEQKPGRAGCCPRRCGSRPAAGSMTISRRRRR